MGERKENLLANTLFPRLSKMCSDLQKSRPPAGHGVSIAHSLHICEQKGGGGEEKSRGTGLESSRNVVSTLAKRSPRADRSEERVQKFDHSFHADSALYKGREKYEGIPRFSPIDPKSLDNTEDVRDGDETKLGRKEGRVVPSIERSPCKVVVTRV